MYTATWSRLAPQVAGDETTARSLALLYCDYYRYRIDVLSSLHPSQVVDVRFEDLTADPEGTIRELYDCLGLTMTHDYSRRLRSASARARAYTSVHDYDLDRFGVERQDIYDRLADVFEEYEFESALPSSRYEILHEEA